MSPTKLLPAESKSTVMPVVKLQLMLLLLKRRSRSYRKGEREVIIDDFMMIYLTVFL
ncbi:hypothetical protein NST28_15930 [Paenibacillus sp. FSL R10-2791]|uniref:hypothetical protein n=1 Tax=Paenibacillus sp. FSL R10-2791 TaxID=2954695 RepID=UPI0030F800A5